MKALFPLDDSLKRRGIRLNGAVIRNSRRMRGWSQFELAEKAGVAERTVRNAERGAPVKATVADYLAGALEIDRQDLLFDQSIGQQKFWNEIAAEFQGSLDEAVMGDDFTQLLSLLHPQVVVRSEAISLPPFFGEFHGHEGVTAYVQGLKRWFDERRIVERKSHLERVDGEGSLLFVRGKDTLIWENGATDQVWFAHFYRLEENRIRVFEQFVGI